MTKRKTACCCKPDDSNDEDDSDVELTCDIEKEFADRTTCHGISYWCNSKHAFQRVFWILLVLGMTGGMLYQVQNRITAYFQYETSTELSREFVNQIAFPAVTICNYNRYFFPTSDNELQGFQLLNRITSPLFIAFANERGFPVPLEAFDRFDAMPDFNISGYLNEKGYQLQDGMTLRECRFKSSACTENDFTSVLTRLGKCHTFNSYTSADLYQTVAGFGQGLQITLNVLHQNYTEEALYGNQEAGIKFQVHSKYEAPNVEKYGVAIPVGHKAFVVISKKDSEIMYAPWGQCYPTTQKVLKYFTTYTLNSCMQECYTDHVIARCGCRTFDQYWAGNYATECTPREVENCSTPYTNQIELQLTPDICDCTIPCTYTEYTTIPSYATSPGLTTRLFFENSLNISAGTGFVEENFLSLDITFSEIGYTKETQSKKIDETALTSDIGGQLGLWVGMSFVTVVEFLQYFTTRGCACACFLRKRRNKMSKSKKSKNSVAEGHANNGWVL